MLIQCRIIRKGGSVVVIGSETYEFRPNADDEHICFVEDKEHIKMFMAVESYHEHGKPPAPKAPEENEGQPKVVDELESDDDDEGSPGMEDLLLQPVGKITPQLSEMPDFELKILHEVESTGTARKTLLAAAMAEMVKRGIEKVNV